MLPGRHRLGLAFRNAQDFILLPGFQCLFSQLSCFSLCRFPCLRLLSPEAATHTASLAAYFINMTEGINIRSNATALAVTATCPCDRQIPTSTVNQIKVKLGGSERISKQ